MSERYVIYIDEAGDDGLGKLRTDRSGQSRWFCVGALIIKAENDPLSVRWRDSIVSEFTNFQGRDLHFKNLNHDKRRFACSVLGSKPCRFGVAMSNKRTLLELPSDRINNYKRKKYSFRSSDC